MLIQQENNCGIGFFALSSKKHLFLQETPAFLAAQVSCAVLGVSYRKINASCQLALAGRLSPGNKTTSCGALPARTAGGLVREQAGRLEKNRWGGNDTGNGCTSLVPSVLQE